MFILFSAVMAVFVGTRCSTGVIVTTSLTLSEWLKTAASKDLAETWLLEAAVGFLCSQEKQRLFGDFYYAANPWKYKRRVIVKAEHSALGENPRYVVTNLPGAPQQLYEKVYCARGESENRIKE